MQFIGPDEGMLSCGYEGIGRLWEIDQIAERALELMCQRSLRREAFGKKLAQLGANYDIIANCRMEIEQARLLCLKAAWDSCY